MQFMMDWQYQIYQDKYQFCILVLVYKNNLLYIPTHIGNDKKQQSICNINKFSQSATATDRWNKINLIFLNYFLNNKINFEIILYYN